MREHTENAAECVLKQEIQDLKGDIMEIKAGMQSRKEERSQGNWEKLEDRGQGNETSMRIKDIQRTQSYLDEGRTHIDDIKYDSNTTKATVTELRKKLFLQKAEIAHSRGLLNKKMNQLGKAGR